MNNSLTQPSKTKFSVKIQSDDIKNLINNTLGDPKRAMNFVTTISSAVAANPSLQACEANSIIIAALVGESLNLSPSPFMGEYFLVPFDTKYGKVAQFQIGYKGYIALAYRTGQYRYIDVNEIREGEYLGKDPETGRPRFAFIEDDDVREDKQVIGYMASYELLNGGRKVLYWNKKKMEKHATTYSPGYQADLKKGTNYTYWSKDFDGMAFKTMLRQLISKWAPKSIEMQKAFESDMGVIKEDGKVEYVETDNENKMLGNNQSPTQPTETQKEPIPNDKIVEAFIDSGKQPTDETPKQPATGDSPAYDGDLFKK